MGGKREGGKGRGADTTRRKHLGFCLVPLLYLYTYLVHSFRSLPQQRQLDGSPARSALCIPRDPTRESREPPGTARLGAAPPPENNPINTLSSLLFIGTTLKHRGSPPGRRRPLRQLPQPGPHQPALAGPLRLLLAPGTHRGAAPALTSRPGAARRWLRPGTPRPPLPRKRCGNTGGSRAGSGRNHCACGGGGMGRDEPFG